MNAQELIDVPLPELKDMEQERKEKIRKGERNFPALNLSKPSNLKLNFESKQIKDAINKGIMQSRLKLIADKLSMDLEQLYNYYIILPNQYPADKLVEELK